MTISWCLKPPDFMEVCHIAGDKGSSSQAPQTPTSQPSCKSTTGHVILLPEASSPTVPAQSFVCGNTHIRAACRMQATAQRLGPRHHCSKHPSVADEGISPLPVS